MADRRTSRGRPRGTTRPTGPRSGNRPRPAAAGAARPADRRTTQRPRLTGRAAILVLVLVVLTVSYASSLRAWLQQREHIADLRAQIERTDKNIDALQREKRRWNDDAYVAQQARERFSYLMPGETGYQVIDEDGEPLDSVDSLPDESEIPSEKPKAWWDTAWESVEAAGDPPTVADLPAGAIKPPPEDGDR
jgi:cell division protein FtsB